MWKDTAKMIFGIFVTLLGIVMIVSQFTTMKNPSLLTWGVSLIVFGWGAKGLFSVLYDIKKRNGY